MGVRFHVGSVGARSVTMRRAVAQAHGQLSLYIIHTIIIHYVNTSLFFSYGCTQWLFPRTSINSELAADIEKNDVRARKIERGCACGDHNILLGQFLNLNGWLVGWLEARGGERWP